MEALSRKVIEATDFRDSSSIIALLETGFRDSPRRLAHMLEVARRVRTSALYICEMSPGVDLDPEAAYCAALVHDIGYLAALNQHDFHPLDAYEFFYEIGYPLLAEQIVAHSNSPEQAEIRGLPVQRGSEDLVAALITYWDIRVKQGGELVSYEERLADIVKRYGEESPVTRAHRVAFPRIARIIEFVRPLLAGAEEQ